MRLCDLCITRTLQTYNSERPGRLRLQSELVNRPDIREERQEELLAQETELKGKVSARCLSVSAHTKGKREVSATQPSVTSYRRLSTEHISLAEWLLNLRGIPF